MNNLKSVPCQHQQGLGCFGRKMDGDAEKTIFGRDLDFT
jgi:hypothetical protein